MKNSNTHCPCCEIFDHGEKMGNTFLICPICNWEDDGVQLDNPDYEGGANDLSLNQAKEIFAREQACADNRIIFMSKPSEFDMRNSFVAHLPKINGGKHLFHQLSEKLQFPNYFGRNRDAVNDCLNDFMWIKEKDIIIVHDSSINLDKKNFDIYVEILHNTILSWLSDSEHTLRIIFRTDYKEIVEGIIKN